MFRTRKSCVNARGIPTAAYEVLYMLSYPGGGGRYLGRGRGVGTLDGGEVGTLDRGVGTLDGGVGTLDRGVGTLDGGGG